MSGDYYQTKESVEEYIKSAEGVNGNALIQKLKPYLKQGSSLLEIGSGPGSDYEILQKDYKVVGSDFSEEFLMRLRVNYPKATFLELDAITLTTDQQFQGIYSNKVLHHLKDNELKQSIKRQSALLNPNGIICHSFWKGEGDEIFKGMYVNYHTAEELKSLFEKEFKLLLLEAYAEFEEGDSLLLIGRKK